MKFCTEERGRGELSEVEVLSAESRVWNEHRREEVVDGYQRAVVSLQWCGKDCFEYSEESTELNIRTGQLN